MSPSFQGGAHDDAVHGKAEYRLFRCVQLRTGYPLCRFCQHRRFAKSTADSAAFCKDTAILAVSFFIIILVSICLCILGLRGLLVRLVLAWGLVIIMMHNSKSAKSNSETDTPEAA